MRKLRTWREYLIKRLSADRDRASGYLQAALEGYQINQDPTVFLLALQTVVESDGGISELAKQTDINPETLSEILTSDVLPEIGTLTTVLNPLGCQISIEPIESAKSAVEIAPTESVPIDAEVAAEN
jgi:DNA-binding phage protein